MRRKQTFGTRPNLSISARLPLGLVLFVALIALSLSVAYADTFVVTTTDDVVDAAGANCDVIAPKDLPGPDGLVSLREAICAANNNPLPDTIDLGPDTYELSIDGVPENENATGDLDVLYEGDDLTIVGEGATSTIIDARQIDRVFDIEPGAGVSRTISISGVTIQGGYVDGPGGGIRNGDAKLTIAHSTIYSNTAEWEGGGIYNQGPLTITHSTIISNTSVTGAGGLLNTAGHVGDPPTRTATIINCTILHNVAGQFVGGIMNVGTMTIVDSTIYSNTAEVFSGGGIYNAKGSVMTVSSSTISDNHAGTSAGGISNDGTMTVTDSTIFGNRADDDGGGISNYFNGRMIVIGSAISDNQAGHYSGGIASGGTMTVTNSTISGNGANDDGGGFRGTGGTASLTHVTITGNSVNGSGGGIYVEDGAITLKNTIVAGNTDHAVPTTHDCGGAAFNVEGDNLVGQNGNPNGCPVGPGVTVVSGAISTVLDPLGDNGGATETHALVAGSPAIDTVTDCTDVAGSPVATDQRGVARPQGAACDIGAYEGEPELTIVKTVVPETGVPYHGVVTYTVVLGNEGLVPASDVGLTDTLPAEVDFGWWVDQPGGATVVGDVLTWNGPVPTDTTVSFSFVATHTGDYGVVVVNTAEYNHSSGSGSDDATFRVEVEPGLSFSVYLPLVLKNW